LTDFPLDAGSEGILGYIQIVVHLQAQPETGRVSEVARQSHRRVGGDAALSMNNLIDSARRDTQIPAEPILRTWEVRVSGGLVPRGLKGPRLRRETAAGRKQTPGHRPGLQRNSNRSATEKEVIGRRAIRDYSRVIRG